MKAITTGIRPFYLKKESEKGANGKVNLPFSLIKIVTIVMLMLTLYGTSAAQEKKQIVRLAKLQIDSTQLENYKAMLKEGIETAVRVEPGVLMYYAVADKNNPTQITILEVYASPEAYRAHLETPHFKKYKNGTMYMVKSLELVDVVPVVFAAKGKSQY